METFFVQPGVLGQAALSLADGFARVLLEKGILTRAEYIRAYDLAIEEWRDAGDHPQRDEVLTALQRIRPAE